MRNVFNNLLSEMQTVHKNNWNKQYLHSRPKENVQKYSYEYAIHQVKNGQLNSAIQKQF